MRKHFYFVKTKRLTHTSSNSVVVVGSGPIVLPISPDVRENDLLVVLDNLCRCWIDMFLDQDEQVVAQDHEQEGHDDKDQEFDRPMSRSDEAVAAGFVVGEGSWTGRWLARVVWTAAAVADGLRRAGF